MKDSYTRFIIFLLIFTAGFVLIARVDVKRLAFDDAKIEARSFLHTVCRLGEVSKASYSSFINSLPHGQGVYDVKISSPGEGKSDGVIRDGLASNGTVKFSYGEEIMIEMNCGDHSFFCRGRVNGRTE